MPSQSKKKGGYCTGHYQVAWRGRDPEASVLKQVFRSCLVDGCDSRALQHKLCTPHVNAARQGLIPVPEGSTVEIYPECSFEGCEKISSSRRNALCHGHYYQRYAGSRVAPLHEPRQQATCVSPGCSQRVMRSNVDECRKHYEIGVAERRDIRLRPLTKVCGVLGCETGMREDDTLCDGHRKRASRHGLTHEQLLTLFGDGTCHACGQVTPLYVDHDHACCPGDKKKNCGKCVRGALCSGCNSSLGTLREDVDRIINLAGYARTMSRLDFGLAA